MPQQPLGMSFAPTFDSAEQAKSSSAGPQGSVQTLNFKLPSQSSRNSVSPQVSQGMAGGTNGALLQQILSRIFGEMAGPSMGSQFGGNTAAPPAPPMAPAANTIPGATAPFGVPEFVGDVGDPYGDEAPWLPHREGESIFDSPEYQQYMQHQQQRGKLPANIHVQNGKFGPNSTYNT